MTAEVFTQIGIGVVLASLGWFAKGQMKIRRQTDDMWKAHLGPNAMDEDGAPKWYVRKSLTEAVEGLHGAIEGLSKATTQQIIMLELLVKQTRPRRDD